MVVKRKKSIYTNSLGFLQENNVKRADSDVLFNCGSSRCIRRLCCNFILKSLVPLAKTEKSAKDTMLFQTNI